MALSTEQTVLLMITLICLVGFIGIIVSCSECIRTPSWKGPDPLDGTRYNMQLSTQKAEEEYDGEPDEIRMTTLSGGTLMSQIKRKMNGKKDEYTNLDDSVLSTTQIEQEL